MQNNNIFLEPNHIIIMEVDGQTIYTYNKRWYTKNQLEEHFNNLELLADATIQKVFEEATEDSSETDHLATSLAKRLKKEINEVRQSLSLASPPIN